MITNVRRKVCRESSCARRQPDRTAEGTRNRRGLTLFEVLLSLTIFVGCMAVIGQLISAGVRGALRARLETQAVLRCETKMAEVVSGIAPLQNVNDGTFSDDPEWHWSLSLTPGPQEDLYLIEVAVSHGPGTTLGSVSYSMQRLMRDPQTFLDAMAEEESSSTSGSSSSSSSGGSSSSSGGSGSSGSKSSSGGSTGTSSGSKSTSSGSSGMSSGSSSTKSSSSGGSSSKSSGSSSSGSSGKSSSGGKK